MTDEVEVRLRRSGWIAWEDTTLADELIALPLLAIGYLINLMLRRPW